MAKMKFKPVILDTREDPEIVKAKHELWRQGDLAWKLKGKQVDIYNDITDQTKDVSVVLCSRRFGKSFSNLIAALEVCIQTPLAVVKYACPTQKMVKSIILPALRIIFADAPPEFDINKLWKAGDNKLEFPNGATIDIAGTDAGNVESLRGSYAHLLICDEAAFMDDFLNVIQSVLLPLVDTTGGKLIMTSTPNFNLPQHSFHTEYVFPNEGSDNVVKFTIYDSPMLNDKEKDKIIARYKKGTEDPRFRCEYLVEIPRATENTIVPEFYEHRNHILLRDEDRKPLDIKLPQYCDLYVGGDHGKRDLTVFVFGYYDFKEATVYIIDEWVGNGSEMTTATVAEAIKAKEKLRFVDEYGNQRKVFKRVMDNNLQMIDDFRILHNLQFSATKKDNLIGSVNELRVLIEEGRLKIHPRCKHTIYHIENAQWKDNKTGKKEFAHLTDSIDGDIKGGHCDALAATLYLVRNVKQNHNPYPDANSVIGESQHGNIINNQTSTQRMMDKLVGIKRKRKYV
jgi:hypothetical protein